MKSEPALSRRDAIAARLAAGIPVLASVLAIEFEVSEDAIRRDLRALAAEGLCRRVYGGALPKTSETKTLSSRLNEHQPATASLARAAAATIQQGELVFIDCGSTNAQLVDFLPSGLQITVATNSPDIARSVARGPHIPLLVIGGMLDHEVGGCVDAAAIAAVRDLRIDRSFVGGCSITSSSGVRAESFAESQFKKTLLAISRVSIVMATAEKFQGIAPFWVGNADDIDMVLIDATVADSTISALADAGFRLVEVSS